MSNKINSIFDQSPQPEPVEKASRPAPKWMPKKNYYQLQADKKFMAVGHGRVLEVEK